MNKIINSIFWMPLLFCISYRGLAQSTPLDQKYVDSITRLLPTYPDDTNKVNHLVRLASMYVLQDPVLTVKYADQGAAIAEKINYPVGIIRCLGRAAFTLAVSGEWAKSTDKVNRAMQLAEKHHPVAMIYLCNIMWINAITKEDNITSLYWVNKALHNPFFETYEEPQKWPTYMQLGDSYQRLGRLDSAKSYEKILLRYADKYGSFSTDLANNSYRVAGNIALQENRYEDAIRYFHLAHEAIGLAQVYQLLNRSDSAIFYAEQSLQGGYKLKMPILIQPAAKILAEEYADSNPSVANKYLNIYINSRDSLFGSEKLKALEMVNLSEQENKFESEKKQTASKNLILMGTLLSVLLIVTIASFLLWRNNRFKQMANAKMEKAYHELKAAQSQLIQSEKMASLGELTAGIAHEIQNPLNFVTNFSEVNRELISELVEEVNKGNTEEVKALANDIKENSEKINHHGKRADAIVKGMLQHSRSSSGIKEPTDINELCDEYLRLSYHGLRAKDKSFNATIKTDFDKNIGNINIIPQDIGRVILNLLTNAFYAAPLPPEGGFKHPEYKHEPTVWVSTKKIGDKVEIKVRDNGPGIPKKILDKIFQPFFTTKPTGQGTGLGLSLSYDIIKAHGGELKVETKVAEGSSTAASAQAGTTFIILLPKI